MSFAESKLGPNGLCLAVGATNLTAQGFYFSLRFRIAGCRPVVKEDWSSA